MFEQDRDRPAGEVFRVDVTEPSRRRRLSWFGGSLLHGLLESAGGSSRPAPRIAVVDRATGRVVAARGEPEGDEGSFLEELRSDLATCSAAEFEDRWVEGTDAT